jgi:hypothetical protein
MSESNTLLSAILAVIYPKLYEAGWETLVAFKIFQRLSLRMSSTDGHPFSVVFLSSATE